MRIFAFLALASAIGSAQVGINTTEPTSMLDVNGGARIRVINSASDQNAAKERIMTTDTFGNVQSITSRQIIQSHLKSFVKGSFSSSGNQTLSFNASGYATLPFNFEEFDENNEYNTSTYTFISTTTGIYSVSIQIKAIAALSLASNFGVAIVKNGTVVARSGFGNIGLLGVTVTPPIRSLNTLVKLESGDTLTFQLYSDLISAGIIGAREDSFFSIAQEQ